MLLYRLVSKTVTTIAAAASLVIALASCGHTGPPGLPSRPSSNSVVHSVQTISAASSLRGFVEYTIPTSNSQPCDITLGRDGNLWFTESNAAKIGRINSAGRITEFAITVPACGITAADDGNLWFSFSEEDLARPAAIGRMTPKGVVALFTLPSLCARCHKTYSVGGITIGTDRALWFGAVAGCGYLCRYGAIIRLTTSGKFTQFAGQRFGPYPTWLTAGPDGAVWFTWGNSIARITTKGTLTAYPLRPTDYAAIGIAAGHDGALWFTDWRSSNAHAGVLHAIGRLTTHGQITAEYNIPTPDSFPDGIVSGPDGNLWFTESNPASNLSKIGRISTAGSIVEFALRPNSGPYRMSVGPGQTLWFTEQTANKIAKFTP